MEAFTAVESRISLLLPDDYKRLVCAFGTGSWKSFLWVLNPFSSNRFLNLLEKEQHQLDAERTIRAQWPKNVPFALYPEPGGLFPWALTDNGDRLYWLTKGNPDEWTTVIFESRGPEYDCHELSCCDLLRRWVGGELEISVFPDDIDYGFAGAFEPLEVS
jgi:hypothetical protein